jgi:hypothetical protein
MERDDGHAREDVPIVDDPASVGPCFVSFSFQRPIDRVRIAVLLTLSLRLLRLKELLLLPIPMSILLA